MEPADGDFNGDGIVNAADYVAWRKGDSPNPNSIADYNTWRANFGLTAGSGAAIPSVSPLSAAVPEPSTWVLLMIAAVGISARH